MQPYRALEQRLGLTHPLPCTPDWSAAPDFLERIAQHCLDRQPALVLECGSGATTVVLARCCQLNGHGRVVSLEHEAEFADATRRSLAQHGLQDCVQVLHAPLRSCQLDGERYDWYSLDGVAAQDIGFVVIDGPPAHKVPHARYPAVPLLLERLAPGCVLMLDDAGRPGELETARMWAERYPQFRQHFIANERGCAVLELPRSG